MKAFLDKWLPRLWGALWVMIITAATISLFIITIKFLLFQMGVM